MLNFSGQGFEHLVGIGPGFHQIGGGSVDLATDLHLERSIGRHGGRPGFLRAGRSVGVGLAADLDFDVVADDRRQDFAVAEIERCGVVFGIDAAVEAESVTVLNDVVRT